MARGYSVLSSFLRVAMCHSLWLRGSGTELALATLGHKPARSPK